MNTLKQILFIFAVIIGLSIAASAQKNDDQKKPPPKDPPPVVNPRQDKPPPRERPREGDKPKKPGMAYSIAQRKETLYIA